MRANRWLVGVVIGAISTGLAVVLAGTAAARKQRSDHEVRPSVDPGPVLGQEVVAPRPV